MRLKRTGGYVKVHTNLDCYTSCLRELQEMIAELLHSSSEKFYISNPLQAFHQSSGPVVYTHSGYYLYNKYTQWTKKI